MKTTDNDKYFIELHKRYTNSWDFRANKAWETIKLNSALSSALTSLAIYSIIYLYTNSFFWDTDKFTIDVKLWVRGSLLLIPFTLFFVNWMCWSQFKRQCRRMYQMATIVFKIEERMGLYNNRSKKEYFTKDEWYIPDEWKFEKKDYHKSEDFVNTSMKIKDRFYKALLWLFKIFGIVSVFLICIELVLLIPSIPTVFT